MEENKVLQWRNADDIESEWKDYKKPEEGYESAFEVGKVYSYQYRVIIKEKN